MITPSTAISARRAALLLLFPALILAAERSRQVEFSGTIQSLPSRGLIGTWRVADRSVEVRRSTNINTGGQPVVVGRTATVKGYQREGSVTANEIEVTGTATSGSGGSGSDDSGSGGGGTTPGPTAGWHLIGWNDLGMHCMDGSDFSVFSILPPYNNIHAHLMDANGNLIKSSSGVSVTYRAIADPTGSINTTSIGKTNFWQYVTSLFGVTLAPDMGLSGFPMPGSANTEKTMKFESAQNWFTAEAIPITPYDDSSPSKKNYYPTFQLTARDSGGNALARTTIVLPVSDELDCAACHASGTNLLAKPAAGWAYDTDPAKDYKWNILRLHDDKNLGTPLFTSALSHAGYNAAGLYATAKNDGKPVLCATCHPSNALPFVKTVSDNIPYLTRAIHDGHANTTDPVSGLTLNDADNRSACYRCHPGAETRCLRGAMGNAVAADGSMAMQCQSCHGDMKTVGASTRQGWFDEPNCQSCHTGTATQNAGQIRYTSVFESSGSVRLPVDTRFATNPDTPAAGVSLYRFSEGHGGLQCSGCHGSTHAIFPSSHENDNLQNIQMQGHAGELSDCAACHGSSPSTVTGGPHGMHPVGQDWVSRHSNAAEGNRSQCQTCHGTDYRGTVLSRSLGDRTLNTSFGTLAMWRGFQVGCYNCHNGPSSESRNSNRAPVVVDLSASTTQSSHVGVQLQGSDADGNSLTFRIVNQPLNGTVALSGTQATYFPFPGTSGSDVFTYAAWDGSTNSNLAKVTVTVQ